MSERERMRRVESGKCSSESCQVVARWPSGKTAVHVEGVVVGSGL